MTDDGCIDLSDMRLACCALDIENYMYMYAVLYLGTLYYTDKLSCSLGCKRLRFVRRY